jgi:hypothetical protein
MNLEPKKNWEKKRQGGESDIQQQQQQPEHTFVADRYQVCAFFIRLLLLLACQLLDYGVASCTGHLQSAQNAVN